MRWARHIYHYPQGYNAINVAELVNRLRALTLRLLPLEVDVKAINDPTNRIITPLVMLSYMEAAGDFGDAVGTSPTLRTREWEWFIFVLYTFSSLTASSEHIQNFFEKHDATLPTTLKTLVVVRVPISILGTSLSRIIQAVTCEVLARRIVHQTPLDRVIPIITNRYTYRESDGDISEASSALEVAIDNHWCASYF